MLPIPGVWSIPGIVFNSLAAGIAQTVEHLTRNEKVVSSNLTTSSIIFFRNIVCGNRRYFFNVALQNNKQI